MGAPADVCVVVEGSYPFVSGGVAAWLHGLIRGLPELSFHIVNISSHPGIHPSVRYTLPENVMALQRVYCRAEPPGEESLPPSHRWQEEVRRIRLRERHCPDTVHVLDAFHELLVNEKVDTTVLSKLVHSKVDAPTLLHGRQGFQWMERLAQQVAPNTPFLQLFWNLRAIMVPVLRLLSTPVPLARCYHALSTGYAGLLASAFSHVTQGPLLLTEHGLYTRERQMELAAAEHLFRQQTRSPHPAAQPLEMQNLWLRFFKSLSRLTYAATTRIVTLCRVNRCKQLCDGADAHKIQVVPNGVAARSSTLLARDAAPHGPLRVGFVGRVVSIKDVPTFIKACDLTLREVDLDVRIYGPEDEEPAYARQCHQLVHALGRQSSIHFMGPQPAETIYPNLDVVVLTSLSEGQPLVILEAYNAGLPVIVTNVGACAEMIEGSCREDRALGPSGILTRVGHPEDTAAALIRLAREPCVRQCMGAAGLQRVARFYQQAHVVESYRRLYRELGMTWQALAGNLNGWWNTVP